MSKYICVLCNYTTNISGNYNRHINSIKHINNNNKSCISCKCGQIFQHKSSLSRHKKICQQIYINTNNTTDLIHENPENNIVIKQLVNILRDSIKKNNEQQKLNNEQQNHVINALSDIIKDQNSCIHTAIINSNDPNKSTSNKINNFKKCENIKINSENKYITFQFYLDDICSNAKPLQDFLMEYVKPLLNKEPYSVNQIATALTEKLKETTDIERPLQTHEGTLFMKLKEKENDEIKWHETDKKNLDNNLAKFSAKVVSEEIKDFEKNHPNWHKSDIQEIQLFKLQKCWHPDDSPHIISSDKHFQSILKASEVDKKQHLIKGT